MVVNPRRSSMQNSETGVPDSIPNDQSLVQGQPALGSCSSGQELDSVQDEYIKNTDAHDKRLKPKIIRNSGSMKDEKFYMQLE